MMFLTSVLTGGQWFLPVIVVLVAAALLASYAKKKKLAKLETSSHPLNIEQDTNN